MEDKYGNVKNVIFMVTFFIGIFLFIVSFRLICERRSKDEEIERLNKQVEYQQMLIDFLGGNCFYYYE